MLGHGAIGQFAIGEVGAQAPEFIGPDKFMGALSEPQRRLPRSPAALYPNFFFNPAPSPFVATGWYQALSEPQLQKRALRAAAQPFFFMQPLPFVATGWYSPLSEPVRIKPALLRALMQFFAIDPNVIPTTRIETWYQQLSEPQRHKIWLLTALQQAFAGPTQLRPNPDITAVMDAIEQLDTFLGGATSFSTPGSGEIGVLLSPPTTSEIGVIPATAMPGETAIIPPGTVPSSGTPSTPGFGKISVRKV